MLATVLPGDRCSPQGKNKHRRISAMRMQRIGRMQTHERHPSVVQVSVLTIDTHRLEKCRSRAHLEIQQTSVNTALARWYADSPELPGGIRLLILIFPQISTDFLARCKL